MEPTRTVEATAEAEAGATGADYNLRILWPLARFVEDRDGIAGLEAIATSAGLTAADFDGKTRWTSANSFEAFLAAVRALVPDDDAFKAACVHRMSEAYGPLRYLLWAASPISVYLQAMKTYRMVSAVGDLKVVSHARARLHVSVTSTRPISRMTCLLRQAQTAALPSIWRLPKAHVREEGCLGLGDASCELHWRWYDRRRWLPSVLGGALVMLTGLFAVRAELVGVPVVALAVMVAAFVGYVWELQRSERVNAGTREEVMEALRHLAAGEADARREILDLHQRQKDWSRILEENAAEKNATIKDIADRVDGLQEARATTLRGFSHDLRNPLAVIQASTDYLRDCTTQLGEEGPGLIKDLDWSVGTMRRMLSELMDVATSQQTFVQLVPQKMEVSVLLDRVKRHLRALAQGRELRVNALATREVPATIELDPLLFDRVIDNLLTNAVKYTKQGSVTVEADGTPGYLVIKVADTGRGIEAAELEKMFSAGGSDPRKRAKDSYGVGLSVVTQLLGQIGGRLEVTSKPGVGTTFWIHFPLQARATMRPDAIAVEKSEKNLFSRVVRIRNHRHE